MGFLLSEYSGTTFSFFPYTIVRHYRMILYQNWAAFEEMFQACEPQLDIRILIEIGSETVVRIALLLEPKREGKLSNFYSITARVVERKTETLDSKGFSKTGKKTLEYRSQ